MALAAGISLLCAFGAWLFIYLGQRAAFLELEKRAVDFAAMIAERARRTNGDLSFLEEFVSRPGPFGEVLHVEVNLAGATILRRSAAQLEEGIPLPNPLPSASKVLEVRTPLGIALAVFYPFLDPDRGQGYVWLAMAEGFRKGFALLAGVVSAVALAVDLSVIALVSLWASRREAPPLFGNEGERVALGELLIDRDAKRVWLRGVEVRLTPKEYALLVLLASSPGRTFSTAEILDAIWPNSKYANGQDVKQVVYNIRKKFERIAPGADRLILTRPGFGYALNIQGENKQGT